ncbi:hypothetical protein JNW88_08150 [Micromonospora sp. ATA32]|nr:hypothetical protein [Micromonospora sp. ATA32]
MTPPTLTAIPATVHRRVVPSRAGQAYSDQADRIRAQLAANQPVIVPVRDHGRGWFVTAVGDGTYEVWRDGQALIAAWTDVPLGAV